MPCRLQGERGTICCQRANFVGARVAYSALTRQRARSRPPVTYGNDPGASKKRAWPEANEAFCRFCMFDRGSRERTEGPVAVEITLEGGQELQGKLLVPPGRGLSDVLNSTSPFIEFEPVDGERMFIAKSALQAVKPTNVPAKPDLWAGSAEAGNFDPLAVLGLKPGSTREEAREAYVRMAKTYHPDRYAAVELPREVRDYLAAMVRRVNAAYQALETAQRKHAAKETPVFTRNGRA